MGKIINFFSYDAQEHTVTTEDGYILKVFRVLKKDVTEEILKTKKVVLCMHGLFVRFFSFIGF